jgi:SAM-dependent methyltransferase
LSGLDQGEVERVQEAYSSYSRRARKRKAWSAANAGNAAMRAELLEALCQHAREELLGDPDPGGARAGAILDMGCGTGHWLEALLRCGVPADRLHGVELQSRRVAASRARAPGTTILQADVRDLPHADTEFSVVLLFTVLSSLADRDDARRALAEASRVTRPGGLVLVYEPRYANPLNELTSRIPVALIASELGALEIHRVTVWPFVARRLGRFTGGMYPWLARRRLATSHLLAIHRKRY